MTRRMAWGWLAVAILVVGLVWACDGIYQITVTVPYCPVSDSARKHADSVPLLCLLDTLRK